MGFYWVCPNCNRKSFYSGSKTTDAITTCPGCKKKLRVFRYKMVVKTTDKPQINHKKPQPLEFNGMVQSLIIALTYAINTVKNKKQVKAKDVNSTWYQHYRSWSMIREYFQKLEDEK